MKTKKQKTLKELEQEFNACVTTCFCQLRASKALYSARFIEDAVEHVADAYMYAGIALETLTKIEDEINQSMDLEGEETN